MIYYATGENMNQKKYIVPAFQRGLQLLEYLASTPEGVTMSDLNELKIPNATLFRLLSTLTANGFAERHSDNSYILTGKLLKIGSAALRNSSIVTLAEPSMRRLRDETDESVMLGVLHGKEGIVLNQVLSNQPVKVSLEIGHHFPLHSAAPAKAMLAFLPELELKDMLQRIKFTPYTKKTITTLEEFRKELAEVRRIGIAFDRGEEIEDIHCAAAPIVESSNRATAAIWISGPASRLKQEKLKKYASAIRKAAAEISEKLKSGGL